VVRVDSKTESTSNANDDDEENHATRHIKESMRNFECDGRKFDNEEMNALHVSVRYNPTTSCCPRMT
jgi:hypothetical protein